MGEFSPIPVVAELENQCVKMVARAVNNGEKLDLLKTLNLVQNFRQPATLLDS